METAISETAAGFDSEAGEAAFQKQQREAIPQAQETAIPDSAVSIPERLWGRAASKIGFRWRDRGRDEGESIAVRD